MRRWAWLKAAGLLISGQLVLDALCYFVMDQPWLAWLAGPVLLALAWWVGRTELREAPRWQAWAASLLWQLLGLVGSVNVLLQQLRLTQQTTLGDTLDFVMETWHTALLPWVSLVPARVVPSLSGEPLSLFFLALPWLSPLLLIWLVLTPRSRR